MDAMTSCHVFSTPTDYPIESAAYNSIQVPERLVQLVERKFAVREVEGSSPDRPNTRGLKITEENVLPFYYLQMVRRSSLLV